MASKKSVFASFLKSKELKLFLTVWLVYIFYLQMFGSSCMANSQSALTAAIVNEGRFEIDTYYKVSCDIAFYNEHYYSGQSPGISFISVPIYAASKPIFYLLPQGAIDYAFDKLEKYGNIIPEDFWGNKKILSTYFTDLNKRQILEYVFISGFILPIFTSSLISALSAILLYLLLKRFTNNEKLRLLIVLLYSFGTLLFPLSTEFFEREIAVAFMFAAFILLFRIRNDELKPKGSTLFASGVLAGLSAWFDYFHLFVSGLLFLYLLSFCLKDEAAKNKASKRFWIFNLNKQKALLLSRFIIGVSIPVLLMMSYYYIIFDSPFAQSYTYRVVPESVKRFSGIFHMEFPTPTVIFKMAEFFIYSPIVILALYGIYRALSKKNRYYHEALSISIFIALTFIYDLILVLSYPSSIAPSFKRYLTPILPYAMVFLPYIFAKNKPIMKQKITILFIIVGVISLFFNWTSAQYGGHHGLTQYNVYEKRFITGVDFFQNGPSSDFLTTLSGVLGGNRLLFNLLGLAFLIFLIYLIWRPCLVKSGEKNISIAH